MTQDEKSARPDPAAKDPTFPRPQNEHGAVRFDSSCLDTHDRNDTDRATRDSGRARLEDANAGARAQQLLRKVELPVVTLDDELLPEGLLASLAGAGLGTPESLAAGFFTTLAAVSAIAGPAVTCEPDEDARKFGIGMASLALRIAMITKEAHAPLVPAPVMSGVLTVEADALAAYHQAVQRAKEIRRAIEQFRKSYQEAKRAAEALGAEPPPTLALADIAELGERPRIAVLDGSAPQIRLALSGNTGVFVLDQRRMPTTSVVNNNHDDAGRLLNEAAAGYPLAVAGPNGRRAMRSLPAAVVGALRLTDDTLDRLTAMQLTSTIFVPAVALPVTSERGALVGLMKQVHAFGREAVVLRLPSGVEEFLRAAESWTLLAATCSPPLSHYYACLPDLACRLAATMHLASTAANGSGLHPHIPPAMVKRAVAIAERFVKPVGRALLEPASAAQDERDARRIIAYALKVASPDNPSFDRRPLLRSKAKSIPSAQRLDAGLRFLRTAGLIAPIGASKGQRFEVSSEIFDLN